MIVQRAACVGLLALLAAPGFAPFLELLLTPSSWQVLTEADRLLPLLFNSLGLAFATLLFALPIALALAYWLSRVRSPGQSLVVAIGFLGLFMPLPVLASCRQVLFGPALLRPWDEGIAAAAMIHAYALLPWLVLILSIGFSQVEVELEEAALLHCSPWQVFLQVTLRRLAPWIGLATWWVFVQTLTEIVVTDVMLVRTFAEEVYTQAVASDIGASRALALNLPMMALMLAGLAWLKRTLRVTELTRARQKKSEWRTGRWVSFVLLLVGLVPIAILIARIGSFAQFRLALVGQTTLILASLFSSFVAACLATSLAWLLIHWLQPYRLARRAWWLFLAILVMMPGPLLGIGAKSVINHLMDAEEALSGGRIQLFRQFFYDTPTPLPVLWVHILRLLPLATLTLTLTLSAIPRELHDAAKMDGVSRWQRFRALEWPSLAPSLMLTIGGGTLLMLGEISASKLVEIPGRATFAQEMFNQMHYGVGPTLAALALAQIALTALFAAIIGWAIRQVRVSSPHLSR